MSFSASFNTLGEDKFLVNDEIADEDIKIFLGKLMEENETYKGLFSNIPNDKCFMGFSKMVYTINRIDNFLKNDKNEIIQINSTCCEKIIEALNEIKPEDPFGIDIIKTLELLSDDNLDDILDVNNITFNNFFSYMIGMDEKLEKAIIGNEYNVIDLIKELTGEESPVKEIDESFYSQTEKKIVVILMSLMSLKKQTKVIKQEEVLDRDLLFPNHL